MILIYKHSNKNNGKCYIGQTKNSTQRRWGKNGWRYLRIDEKTGKHHHPKFSSAIKKYGWESFNHEVIFECEDKNIANQMEIYYINLFDSIKNGYNLSLGGNNIPINSGEKHHFYNKTFTIIHKKRLSENHADFKGSKHPKAKKVILKDLSTGIEYIYNSLVDVESHKEGWKYGNIKQALRNKVKFYKHFTLTEYKGKKISLQERKELLNL